MEIAQVFLMIGTVFAVGLGADLLARRLRLPRVTALLLAGLALGQSGAELLPSPTEPVQQFLSVTALSMVAFLLGSSLSVDTLRSSGRAIVMLSLAVVLGTLGVVTLGLWAFGLPLGLALLLAAIATATDPAATQEVIAQSGQDSRFTRTLKGIVAIDDAWGLIAFSLVVLVVQPMAGGAGAETGVVMPLLREIFGSILLGAAGGLLGGWLSGRLSPGQPLQIEALALVFILTGAALALDLSYLITGMVAGAVLVNTARHHDSTFHEIDHIKWPFMVLFFVLAGAALDLGAVAALGLLGAAFIALRIVSRVIGGWVGAQLSGTAPATAMLYGPALLPQAGVAVGTALIAAETFPQWAGIIMPLTLGATVVFELIGPPLALWAIKRSAAKAGQTPGQPPS